MSCNSRKQISRTKEKRISRTETPQRQACEILCSEKGLQASATQGSADPPVFFRILLQGLAPSSAFKGFQRYICPSHLLVSQRKRNIAKNCELFLRGWYSLPPLRWCPWQPHKLNPWRWTTDPQRINSQNKSCWMLLESDIQFYSRIVTCEALSCSETPVHLPLALPGL